ncbi:hypothetical protein QYF36_026506 [Acer negundo]|nr:hypothetical protein QYF36_026506 [Acer negundo]
MPRRSFYLVHEGSLGAAFILVHQDVADPIYKDEPGGPICLTNHQPLGHKGQLTLASSRSKSFPSFASRKIHSFLSSAINLFQSSLVISLSRTTRSLRKLIVEFYCSEGCCEEILVSSFPIDDLSRYINEAQLVRAFGLES